MYARILYAVHEPLILTIISHTIRLSQLSQNVCEAACLQDCVCLVGGVLSIAGPLGIRKGSKYTFSPFLPLFCLPDLNTVYLSMRGHFIFWGNRRYHFNRQFGMVSISFYTMLHKQSTNCCTSNVGPRILLHLHCTTSTILLCQHCSACNITSPTIYNITVCP